MAKRAHKVQVTENEAVDASVQSMVDQVLEDTVTEETVTEVTQVTEVDANGRKKKVDLTMEELEQKGLKNKSQVIRFLDGEGYSRSGIALFLNVRYQHVRNVLVTPLKKT